MLHVYILYMVINIYVYIYIDTKTLQRVPNGALKDVNSPSLRDYWHALESGIYTCADPCHLDPEIPMEM